MTDAERRLRLITEVADKMYSETETFEGELGVALSYLYPAIARGTAVEWEMASPSGAPREQELIDMFMGLFPPEHPIWDHIDILEEA